MNLVAPQYTLKSRVFVSGIGLHTGDPVFAEFLPAQENTGIVFVRTDLSHTPLIKASLENVTSTNRGTTLTSDGVCVTTVEHLLSALYGFGIDNCQVNISSEEPPAMDGSSLQFYSHFKTAGKIPQNVERPVPLSLNERFSLKEKDKEMTYVPSDRFEVSFTLEYSNKILPPAFININVNQETFENRISIARTFGFEHEFDMLTQNKLARGGSLKNAVVIANDGKVLNPEGLRDEDELILHKILDLIGDFSLLNRRIKGHIIAQRTGHYFNVKFARLLEKKFLETS